MRRVTCIVLGVLCAILNVVAEGMNPTTDFTYTTNDNVITITDYIGSNTVVNIPNIINGFPVISIGDSAFALTDVTSVTIPNSITSIGWGAFAITDLTSVTIPNSVMSIGDSAFYDCFDLTSVTIPDSIASIGAEMFYGCNSLTSVTIPDSITSIGDQAFFYCTGLISITIPNSVTSIGGGAFQSCTGLTSVYFQGDAPSLGGSSVFSDSDNATVYYLPSTTGWTNPWGGRPTVLLDGDSDSDSLQDAWEVIYFGDLLQGTDDNPDGDAYVNWQEMLAGTNPKDETSYLEIRALGRVGHTVTVAVDTEAGRIYQLQKTTNLSDPDAWADIGSSVSGDGTPMQMIDLAASEPASYYRMSVRMP